MFFGEFQCLPVNDCPAASCDSGILARGIESTSFYSAILVPPVLLYLWLKIIRTYTYDYSRTLTDQSSEMLKATIKKLPKKYCKANQSSLDNSYV